MTPLALLSALQGDLRAVTDTSETLRLLDMPAPWVVVLVLVPLVALVTWIGYRREGLSTRARFALMALRFLSLSSLLLVLFRPVLVQAREEIEQAEVVLLVDDSASMRRKDAYTGDGRTADALARLAPRALDDTMRHELARAGIERELLPRLEAEGYDVRVYRFADGVTPAPDLAGLEGRGHATFLGSALSQALAAHRGRHVTDFVLVSDGRNNGGAPPLEAARGVGAAGIPLHTVVVGDTRPERNAIVELVEAPASALDGDEIAVTVRVLARGLDRESSTQVLLEELQSKGDPRPRLLGEQTVALDENGVRVVLVAPGETPDPRAGERRFRVSVPPQGDETLLDDNAIEFTVRVTPEKIRVLYVDGYPRWEYRYLKNLLLRADTNLQVQCYLLSATPDFPQESSEGLPALTSVPTGRKELLDAYDVVVLGDVNPYAISPDPARCAEFLSSLREFVERGGGLILQAGEYDNPKNFLGTALEELAPVVLDASGALAFEGDTTREARPVLEDPLNPHQIVRLHPEAETNRALWEDDGGLRGFYWYFPVVRAKPGARVLLRHPTAEGPHGRFPLLVSGYFPAGRTLFVAIDSTWMWRYRYGDRYHERFWRSAIRWVALGRLKSGDRRIRLESLRAVYDLDERVTLEARVLDEDYRPSERPTQEVRVEDPEGAETDLALDLVPERPGLYRRSFEPERPGLWRGWVEQQGERAASVEWEVVLPSRENADPAPDPTTLQALASMTGGRSVPLAALGELAREEFPGDEERRKPISSELEDAWDRWLTLLAVLALLSAEWIVRKRLELI